MLGVQCVNWQKKGNRNTSNAAHTGTSFSSSLDSLSQHKGTEWLGEDETRLVVVRIKRESKLEIINLKGKPLRSINLAGMKTVHGWLSSNKRRNVILLRVPKEYDLVKLISR